MITPLHNAAWKGNLCTIKKLIQAGAEISARSASGFTPLHSAASAGKTSSSEFLILAGADLMIEDKEKRLPFQTAFEYGKINTAYFLLKKTLEKSKCSFSSFRQGLCLHGRYSRRMERSISKIGISGDLQ